MPASWGDEPYFDWRSDPKPKRPIVTLSLTAVFGFAAGALWMSGEWGVALFVTWCIPWLCIAGSSLERGEA